MKRLNKIFLTLVASFILVATAISGASIVSAASSNAPVMANRTINYEKDALRGITVQNLNGGKCSKWKSSNKNVLAITGGGTETVWFKIKGTGKSTLSCTVKRGKKTYNVKCTVTVKKLDPVKYIKINGKDVYKKYKGTYTFNYKSNARLKLQWKLNKGWRVTEAYWRYENSSEWHNLKSGNTLKMKKGTNILGRVDFYNEKNENFIFEFTVK